jgi:hypothetical protein
MATLMMYPCIAEVVRLDRDAAGLANGVVVVVDERRVGGDWESDCGWRSGAHMPPLTISSMAFPPLFSDHAAMRDEMSESMAQQRLRLSSHRRHPFDYSLESDPIPSLGAQ